MEDVGAPPAATPRPRIVGHVLPDSPFSKAEDDGVELTPRFILIQSTLSGFDHRDAGDEDRPLSGHVVVSRSGALVQLNPFDRRCSYAGPSNWRGHVQIDRESIGIWLENYGPLWRDATGAVRAIADNVRIPDHLVYQGAHRLGGQYGLWESFPHRQLQSLRGLLRALCAEYPTIRDVVGMDSAAPMRSYDPGPALPLAWLLHRIPFPAPVEGLAVAPLPVQAAPGSNQTVTSWTIPAGERFPILTVDGEWAMVRFTPERGGGAETVGWVSTRMVRMD